MGSTIELISLCKEVQFGDSQINNMLLLYQSLFLPRLVYNCEAWSNISESDYKQLQNAQLAFLRRVMEVPRSTPVAATFLELGILPIRYEIEKRQLLFLKRILSRETCDPLLLTYEQMLRMNSEPNWANGVLDLRQKYSLPLNDTNIRNMSSQMWKFLVVGTVKKQAFSQLSAYARLQKSSHINVLGPQVVRVLFRAKLRMFDLKTNFKRKYTSYSCPFCGAEPETFDHLFKCIDGLYCPQSLKHVTLQNLANTNDIDRLKQIGCFLLKYQKYRDVYEGR